MRALHFNIFEDINLFVFIIHIVIKFNLSFTFPKCFYGLLIIRNQSQCIAIDHQVKGLR